MKIGIVNYDLGNVGSVYSAFKFYKFDVSLINNPNDLETTDIIVLAGVGNFKTVAARLKELNFWDKLNKEVLHKNKAVLGICLGMQLFAEKSYEDGVSEGLGWIRGEVVKMSGLSVKVPHIGWDEIQPLDNEALFGGIRYNSFYFMHSYHFMPSEQDVIIAKIKGVGQDVVAAVKKDNIVGVQFHPEKSQGDGLRFLKNFVEFAQCYTKG